jgi:hypothetical protein
MTELEWMDDIGESNDRKCHLWHRWEQLEKEIRDTNWPVPCFSFWCEMILQTPEYYDRFDQRPRTYYRKDVLDVLLAHTRGDININTPYPWQWKVEELNELR